jgi:hypothetical protein
MGVNCPQTVHRLGLSTIRPGERSVHAQSGNMTRARQFDGGSAAVASISCSPRHPSALQIDPPAASESLPSGFARVNFWRHSIIRFCEGKMPRMLRPLPGRFPNRSFLRGRGDPGPERPDQKAINQYGSAVSKTARARHLSGAGHTSDTSIRACRR